MTPDDAVDFIQLQLGFRSGLNSEIITKLNDCMVMLEDDVRLERPGFLLQEYSNAAFKTTASTRTVAVPSGFLGESEADGGLYIYDAAEEDPYIELTKNSDGRDMRAYFVETGQPEVYKLRGRLQVEFFPMPDAEYVLRWFAYFRDSTPIVEGGATNLWLTHAPYLLISEAGLLIASATRSQGAVQFFSAMNTAERAKLIAKTIAEEEENEPSCMGGDD